MCRGGCSAATETVGLEAAHAHDASSAEMQVSREEVVADAESHAGHVHRRLLELAHDDHDHDDHDHEEDHGDGDDRDDHAHEDEPAASASRVLTSESLEAMGTVPGAPLRRHCFRCAVPAVLYP